MTTPWPTVEMRDRLADLRQTASELESMKRGSGFIELCLARYLTVRSAGYIETVRDDAAEHFTSATSHPYVVDRVGTSLRRGQSAGPGDLTAFVKTFNPGWESLLKDHLGADGARLSNAIGSLVRSRKNIAHGNSDGVDRDRALLWFKAAEEVGLWFITTFDSRSLGEVTRRG